MFDPEKYSLRQNARGIWEIRWSEKTGDRYVSRSHSTRQTELAAAKLYRHHWLKAQHDLERAVAPPATVGDLLDAYELSARSRKVGKTQYVAMGHLRRFFGHLTAPDLTPELLLDYRAKRGVSDSTLRRELNTLVATLNFARRHRKISADDVPHVDLPAEGERREVFLSAAEDRALTDLLLEDPGSRVSRAMLLALRTGARRSAICGLTWDRVNFEHGFVDYRDPGVRRSKKRRVPVPVDDVLKPVLQAAQVAAVDEYVIGRGDLRYEFDAWRAAHPRFAHATFHVLRHTAATRWLRDGLSVWAVAGLLGDTVETTTRVYGHHATCDLRAAMNRATAVAS